jgi:hypothetical protein
MLPGDSEGLWVFGNWDSNLFGGNLYDVLEASHSSSGVLSNVSAISSTDEKTTPLGSGHRSRSFRSDAFCNVVIKYFQN